MNSNFWNKNIIKTKTLILKSLVQRIKLQAYGAEPWILSRHKGNKSLATELGLAEKARKYTTEKIGN